MGTKNNAMFARLTERQREVLAWIARGKSPEVVAQIVEPPISRRGVRFHLQRIYERFGVATREQAIVQALKEGDLHLESL